MSTHQPNAAEDSKGLGGNAGKPAAKLDRAPMGGRGHFTARDLFLTALFSVIYVVVTFVLGMLGFLGPLAWILSIPLAVFINGVVFTLFLAKTRVPGMITLFGVVAALALVLHGTALTGVLFAVVAAIIADVVFHMTKRNPRTAAIASYSVFGLVGFAPFIQILMDRKAYFSSEAWQQMGDAYVQASDKLFTTPILLGLAVACVIAGCLGAMFGTAMLRKHFAPAGLA